MGFHPREDGRGVPVPISTGVAVGFVSEEGTPQYFNEIGFLGVVDEEVDTPVVSLVVDGEREVPLVIERDSVGWVTETTR